MKKKMKNANIKYFVKQSGAICIHRFSLVKQVYYIFAILLKKMCTFTPGKNS